MPKQDKDKHGQDGENYNHAMQRRIDKKRERLEKPFGQSMAKRLFVLFLVIAVGFGLYDVVRLIGGTPGLAATAVFGSLLVACLVVGLPLAILCLVQLRRIQLDKIREEPVAYRRWLLVSAGLTALVLVCWLVSLVVK